jgi:hypothetical protein
MKVIQKGREQKGWSTEATCTGVGNGGGGCGAVLFVEQPDMYKTYRHSYDGDKETFVTFECIECGIETDIPNVPYQIISKIKDKKK